MKINIERKLNSTINDELVNITVESSKSNKEIDKLVNITYKKIFQMQLSYQKNKILQINNYNINNISSNGDNIIYR